MKKFLTTVAVLTAVATPAFAQSFDPEIGTGNVLPFSYRSTDHRDGKIALRDKGLNAYAAAPSVRPINPNSPEATGGGSLGYNEMLRIY